jgi:serine/threonine kinase PknH
MEPLTRDDPRQIAGYRLQARLGAGGMGLVYLGFTPGGRAVAVKVMRPELGDDRGFRDRFRQEIEAARRVHGLYTAQVIDADPAAVPPWLVTVYVAGPSLQQAVADHGPMPAQTGYRIMAGVAEALQAIHAAGVVHRDLKPSNVLLAADGPRVIDFGIARAVEATALTRTGMLIGSPQFMAPEQVAGQPTTPATDIFALGSLAAYAVLGRAPFGDGVGEAVLYRVLHQDPDLAGCPMPLRTVIERCLARDPARRPGPAEIISFCRAQQADHATEIAQSWLPPGVAADLAYRSTLVPALPGQAAPAGGPAPIPTAVATPPAAGPPQPAWAPPQPAWAPPQPAWAPPQPAWAPPQPAGSAPQPAWGQPQPAPEARMPRIYPPSSVVAAARLMYVGAAGAVLNGIVAAAAAAAYVHNTAEKLANVSQNYIAFWTRFDASLAIFFGLAWTGLWLWMAYANRRGRSWARILSTVLFAIDTLALPWTIIEVPSPAKTVLVLLLWPVSLAAAVLLWVGPSNAYFAYFAAMRRPANPYPPPYPR